MFSTPENLLVRISGDLGTKVSHFPSKNVLRKCSRASQKQWMLELSNLAIVFSTPEILLVEISVALGMKVSHFLSKNVFWENAVGYLRNGGCSTFQTFAIVFSTPDNLLVRISGAPGNKVSHFLSKNVLRKCYGVSQKQWMLELSNLCHCVQHPWKFNSMDFWRSRNKSKPLSKQKCVLRICCRVSQKCWILELSNLCNCV